MPQNYKLKGTITSIKNDRKSDSNKYLEILTEKGNYEKLIFPIFI